MIVFSNRGAYVAVEVLASEASVRQESTRIVPLGRRFRDRRQATVVGYFLWTLVPLANCYRCTTFLEQHSGLTNANIRIGIDSESHLEALREAFSEVSQA